jgi:hypothetical protein
MGKLDASPVVLDGSRLRVEQGLPHGVSAAKGHQERDHEQKVLYRRTDFVRHDGRLCAQRGGCTAAGAAKAPTLYTQLGRYDALAAVTDDFIKSLATGPCLISERITEAEWNTSAQHLVDTLNKFKVPQAQQTAVMGAISALKGDIVGQ